jgi:hypothetical protein
MTTEMRGPNQAYVEIAAQLIVDALHLPHGSAIIDASFDFQRQVVTLRVHHHSLPDATSGEIPRAIVECERIACRYRVE